MQNGQQGFCSKASGSPLAHPLQDAFELIEIAEFNLDFAGTFLVGNDFYLRTEKIR